MVSATTGTRPGELEAIGTVRVSRQLLDAITGFRTAYEADPKFKTVLAGLDQAEQQIETLVPGAADRAPDAADGPVRSLPAAAAKARALLKDRRTQQQGAADSGATP